MMYKLQKKIMKGYYKDQNPNQFTYLIFFLFVVLIKIIQIFFQILVHCMIWCDDGLPKNSRAKLYSIVLLLFHRHNFFLPSSSSFFILYIFETGSTYVFLEVSEKHEFFFGGKFNSDTLLPTTHWALKKVPRNAIFLFRKMH